MMGSLTRAEINKLTQQTERTLGWGAHRNFNIDNNDDRIKSRKITITKEIVTTCDLTGRANVCSSWKYHKILV